MVEESYMTEQVPAPSALRRTLDQRALPLAIDAAGAVEAVIERLAVQVRRTPGPVLGAALTAGFLACWLGRRRAR